MIVIIICIHSIHISGDSNFWVDQQGEQLFMQYYAFRFTLGHNLASVMTVGDCTVGEKGGEDQMHLLFHVLDANRNSDSLNNSSSICQH